jgi:hypothetical protein
MTSGVYDNFMVKIMTGQLGASAMVAANTGGGTFPGVYSMLSNGQPTQTLSTANCEYDHVESQISATNGYVLGGSAVNTLVPTMTSHVTGIKTNANLVYTTTQTLTAQWLNLQFALTALTTAANPLMCFLDMGAQSVTSGTLTIAWNSNGIFTLTVAAAG